MVPVHRQLRVDLSLSQGRKERRAELCGGHRDCVARVDDPCLDLHPPAMGLASSESAPHVLLRTRRQSASSLHGDARRHVIRLKPIILLLVAAVAAIFLLLLLQWSSPHYTDFTFSCSTCCRNSSGSS